MIRESTLLVSRTARVFTLNQAGNTPKKAWILLHGYGQSAIHFLRKFEYLSDEETVLVAPEGLSRYYLKGFDGRVGASWMTKEARQHEIDDQLYYIDKLVQDFDLDSVPELNILGFSQGAAVACRWFQDTRVRIKNLVIWGAGLPIETTAEMAQKYSTTKTIFMLGDEDEFIRPETLKEHFSRLDLLNFTHQRIMYKGGHQITKEGLEQLEQALSVK